MPRLYLWLVLLLACAETGTTQTAFDTLQPYYYDTLYYETGRHELTVAARTVLDRAFAQWQPGSQVHLTGHTDARGSEAANALLSKRRCASAATYLRNQGLPDTVLRFTPFGENHPVDDNDNELGRQRNRRVTLAYYRQERRLPISGTIRSAETGEPVPALIRWHGPGWEDSTRTDERGYYRYLLPADKVVGRDIFAEGHFYKTDLFKAVPEQLPAGDIDLQPATAGRSMDIPDFFFYGNRADLLPRSVPQLEKLHQFMLLNANLSIEIAGHINLPFQPPVANDTWNYNLSVNRAKMVYAYLIAQGIAPERLRYQGYGNSQMRFPQARTEADQAANRRVEIIVRE